MKTRAIRRHHAQRMKARAYRKISTTSHFCSDLTDQELWDMAGRLRDHLCDCSCPMCGNPRRSVLMNGTDRYTMQEHRAPDISTGLQDFYGTD